MRGAFIITVDQPSYRRFVCHVCSGSSLGAALLFGGCLATSPLEPVPPQQRCQNKPASPRRARAIVNNGIGVSHQRSRSRHGEKRLHPRRRWLVAPFGLPLSLLWVCQVGSRGARREGPALQSTPSSLALAIIVGAFGLCRSVRALYLSKIRAGLLRNTAGPPAPRPAPAQKAQISQKLENRGALPPVWACRTEGRTLDCAMQHRDWRRGVAALLGRFLP